MTANAAAIQIDDGDGEPTEADLETLQSQVSPKLVQGERELEPIVVTRLGGTLPWDTDTAQLYGGDTLTDSSGDKSNRLVYKAVVTKTQFETLAAMRQAATELRLVSAAYTGLVTFDELKFDRITDANGAIIKGSGSTDEPLYEIQLQSKENNEDEGVL
jgi:hypothetical protein